MAELEQITYVRVRKDPTLKQFLVRKAVAEAASRTRGQTGVMISGGRPMPASAALIKDYLPNLKDTDSLMREHPEWVEEYKQKYG